MKPGIFSLRRLRWKLTLSYTAVTVVALLSLELLLIGGLAAFLYSPAPPYLISQWLAGNVSPRLEPYLAQDPPDLEGLRTTFQEVGGDVGGGEESTDPTDLDLFVLAPDRRLLAESSGREDLILGERFEANRFPGLPSLVGDALDNKGDPGPLSASTPERRFLAVVPVRDDGGNVVGLLVGTLHLPNLAGAFAIVAVVGGVLVLAPAAFLGTIFGFLTAWGLTRRIGRLAAAARSWSQGNFSVTAGDRSKDELGQLSRELNQMAGQLEALIETRGELATLEARNRLARDLHDSVKQQVFATSLQLAAARALVERDATAAGTHLDQAADLVRQAQKELNVLIHEMRPAALEGKGLAAALRDYAETWSLGSEIPADVRVRGEREVPLEVEQTAFRVAQEALANVAKHSGASRAGVDLFYTPQSLTLRVTDDGRGFKDAEDTGEGFGLRSMSERASALGGHVEVESAPGKGTRVECVCPLEADVVKKGWRPWTNR